MDFLLHVLKSVSEEAESGTAGSIVVGYFPLCSRAPVWEPYFGQVCVNSRQASKDTSNREAIIKSLKEQLKKGAKSLVGNKGFRRYLKIAKDSARINTDKVKEEARFDGK